MISDLVQRLFNPAGLTPHGFCLLWEPWLIWTHALSDVAIGLAYFSIPATLLSFARRRLDLVFRPVFALFAAFIVLCGAGHWADLMTIWWPFYGAEALVKAGTAAVSLATAAVLWRLLPAALALPSPAQLRAANETLREAEDHLRHTVELNPQVPWTADPCGRITSVGRRWLEVTGLAPEEALNEDGWARLVHQADRANAMAAWRHAISTCEPLDIEVRLRVADGSYRWWRIRASPRRDMTASGQVVRWYGAAEDIHERRAAEERQMLLAREVDHRAKNALAVVLSLLRLTPRKDPARFAAAIEGRVAAMARAHSLLSKERWAGADLRTLAEDELAAYAGRVVLSGLHVRLTPEAAQPVAMLLHELATNAAKHGALSAEIGRVSLSWGCDGYNGEDGALQLDWEERDGPPLEASPPTRHGFGSRLISTLASQQLGGSVTFDWNAAGLSCRVILAPHFAALAKPAAAPAADSAGHGEQLYMQTWTQSVGRGAVVACDRLAPPPRILVVEDEALLAMELEGALRRLGYEVVGPARTLGEAVRLAAGERNLAAAVMDVNLGGQLSFPAVDLLETRGVPYILATGYGSAGSLEGRDRDAVAVLIKPYPQKVLAKALSEALRQASVAPRRRYSTS